MLAYAAERVREEGLAGIRFVQAGFLTYGHAGEPFDAVVSGLALHHLPDHDRTTGRRRPPITPDYLSPDVSCVTRNSTYGFMTAGN